MKRAEKVLYFGEQILTKAIEAEDFKLALQAVDRARASLDQLLKVHGLLTPDSAANVTIDQRRQVIAVMAKLTEDDLRSLVNGGAQRVLPSGENGTPFRDQSEAALP